MGKAEAKPFKLELFAMNSVDDSKGNQEDLCINDVPVD